MPYDYKVAKISYNSIKFAVINHSPHFISCALCKTCCFIYCMADSKLVLYESRK